MEQPLELLRRREREKSWAVALLNVHLIADVCLCVSVCVFPCFTVSFTSIIHGITSMSSHYVCNTCKTILSPPSLSLSLSLPLLLTSDHFKHVFRESEEHTSSSISASSSFSLLPFFVSHSPCLFAYF